MQMLDSFFKNASNFFGAVSMFFMAFLMVGTTVDITVRALHGKPISGVFELAELSMVLVVFLGLGWTQRDRAHIRVTILTDKLPPVAERVAETISWAAAALLLLLLAMPSTEDAINSFMIKEFRWGYIEFPIWWAKIILAVALWFGFLQMLADAFRTAICGVTKQPDPADLY